MTIKYHFLDSTGQLSPYKEHIHQYVGKAIEVVDGRLEICTDLCVGHEPYHCNPDLGIGGGAFSPSLMHIFLDANNPKLTESIRKELLAVLAHEAHHCARMQSVPEDVTLLDSLVTEGLACCFETEVTGYSAPSFIPSAVLNTSEELMSSMRPLMRDAEFCFDTIFLGKDTETYPKYAGFAVGFELVRRYLLGTGSTAAESVQIASRDVLELAQYMVT